MTLSSDKDFAFLNDTIHFTQTCLNNCLQYNYQWDNGDSGFIPTWDRFSKLIFWNQSNIKDSLIKNVIIKKKSRITNQTNITRIPFRISDEKLYIDIFIEESTEVILTDIIGRVLYREKGKNLIELSKFEKQILILKVNKENAKAEIFA
ncbi:MAG: hypothetical protein IPK03_11400 [Bacteroidetes bacterium]|nr:hypothetical protein [Bacteroidota bacterium]